MIRVLSICALLAAGPAQAVELAMPQAARQISDRSSVLDSYDLPVAAFDGASVPSRRFEGAVQRRTYRMDGSAETTLQILKPLRDQLIAEGYTVVFDCKDEGCGGFDFRFGTEIVPAPDMHVDLRNFRFLSATRGTAEAVSVLVSVSRTMTFLQVIAVGPVKPA